MQSWSAVQCQAAADWQRWQHALHWQAAAHQAAWTVQRPPPPPPPPLAESESSASEDSGNEAAEVASPISQPCLTSQSLRTEGVEEERLEQLRLRLANSNLFKSLVKRRRLQRRDLALQSRLMAAYLKVESDDDGEEALPQTLQVERRAQTGHATLQQVVATSWSSSAAACSRSAAAVVKTECPRPSKKAGLGPLMPQRKRRRGGRRRNRPARKGVYPSIQRTIPRWSKRKGKGKSKGGNSITKVQNVRSEHSPKCCYRRVPLPLPVRRPTQPQQVTIEWTPCPTARARPSSSVTVRLA